MKNKPRHNPDKPQNKKGNVCSHYEKHEHGFICEGNWGDVNVCKGNPHNCIKNKYKLAQITKLKK